MESMSATILVVDDEPSNIELIHATLKNEYKLRAANNGEGALKAVLIYPLPDLVILDIMMPGMDGYEVCRQLKANPVTKDIPVIFLTAKSQIEDEAKGFQVGAVDYIHKPISPPILQARIQTHISLKQIRDSLEETVKLRTAELGRALEQALAAGKAKTAFLQTMSHELRTPLNHILGYSEMLEEELEDKPELLKDLRKIRSSGKHLLQMIASVLEYARSEGAENVTHEKISVASVIGRAAGDCEEIIRKSNNQIEFRIPEISILIDSNRLQSIIAELIKNAAKFTNGGRITVSARSEANSIVIDVADTGIGMNAEQIQHCFEAFWQADTSTSRAYEGTGMGLASAKQLVRQIGGEITVDSEPGKGSTFHLRIPGQN